MVGTTCTDPTTGDMYEISVEKRMEVRQEDHSACPTSLESMNHLGDMPIEPEPYDREDVVNESEVGRVCFKLGEKVRSGECVFVQ